MTVFIDTSAIFAVMDGDDANHLKAKKIWEELLTGNVRMIVSNYILVESHALIQSRLGMQAVRTFHEDLFPLLSVEWVDRTDHLSGVAALLATSKRRLSLVDCVSFNLMRRLGIREAFAFDQHFRKEGFRCLR